MSDVKWIIGDDDFKKNNIIKDTENDMIWKNLVDFFKKIFENCC